MASLNRITLIGNLGRDPEVRYMPDNTPVANVSIATTEKWKDKQGEKHEETTWHNLQFFGALAEVVEKYVKKGDAIYVEGRLTKRKYTAKDGTEKEAVEVRCDRMQMLGGKPQGEAPAQQRAANAAKASDDPFADFESDLPFATGKK